MLSEATIKEWAKKWQTLPINVAREYAQNVFLSALYQFPETEHLGFKGGTALRLIFKSPRFSEDLDFTGHLKPFHIEKLLAKTVRRMVQEMIRIEMKEAKPTSGGFLALYEIQVNERRVNLELNISLREKPRLEPILVVSPLLPSYQCLMLATDDLVREKCQALLTRKKPRDYFDLYFLLRERLGLTAIIPSKKDFLKLISALDSKAIHQELKTFLPVSHHRIVSQLKESLSAELNRL